MRSFVSRTVAYFFLLVVVAQTAEAQNFEQTAHRHFNKSLLANEAWKRSGTSPILSAEKGEKSFQTNDLSKPVRIIVEFIEPPVAVQQIKGQVKTTTYSTALSRSQQLLADLQRIQTNLTNRLRLNLPPAEIGRTFYKVFNGASATVATGALTQISRLPYVKRIHFDHEVAADLHQSIPLIRADAVWQQFGSQGEGVVVGVIDTGIDYTHPALGGGFGPDFKVIGGYDLINDDPDPIDDNNHGTHVAGIVAAGGAGITGVAPKAKLMAFKVLSAAGSGPSSVVIAGIERAVDPNDDGDFSDRVHIVNMSLGGEGSPDDAKSIAVDNAVALGMTFCISAGNSGSFYSIGSPGTARSAITVGATSKSDVIADFSSKGPNRQIFTIKPDLVAPGAAITSSIRNGETASFNGTSMAAPHVAGVAALLKSLHPEWSPARIKSAIVNTAVDLGEHVMAQGAGRLDALNAAKVQSFCEPVQINFGFAGDGEFWHSNSTVTFTNDADTPQTFTAATGSLRSGIELQIAPAAFELGAGESRNLEIALTVDNALVPYLTNSDNTSISYGGLLSFNGSVDTLRVPWTFTKTHRLTIISDDLIADTYLTSNNAVFSIPPLIGTNPFIYQEIVTRGLYDFAGPDAGSGPYFHERDFYHFRIGHGSNLSRRYAASYRIQGCR